MSVDDFMGTLMASPGPFLDEARMLEPEENDANAPDRRWEPPPPPPPHNGRPLAFVAMVALLPPLLLYAAAVVLAPARRGAAFAIGVALARFVWPAALRRLLCGVDAEEDDERLPASASYVAVLSGAVAGTPPESAEALRRHVARALDAVPGACCHVRAGGLAVRVPRADVRIVRALPSQGLAQRWIGSAFGLDVPDLGVVASPYGTAAVLVLRPADLAPGLSVDVLSAQPAAVLEALASCPIVVEWGGGGGTGSVRVVVDTRAVPVADAAAVLARLGDV